MNGIHVNKYIKRWLTGDTALCELVRRENMAPLQVAPTERPIITWSHGPIEPDYAKAPDGQVVDHLQVGIIVVTNDYEEGIDIAARVREIFEMNSYRDEHIHIPVISVAEISEDVVDDSYIQSIILDFEVETERS